MELKDYKLFCVFIVALKIIKKKSICYFKNMNHNIDIFQKVKSNHTPRIFRNSKQIIILFKFFTTEMCPKLASLNIFIKFYLL